MKDIRVTRKLLESLEACEDGILFAEKMGLI
jgi:hypothetical protein